MNHNGPFVLLYDSDSAIFMSWVQHSTVITQFKNLSKQYQKDSFEFLDYLYSFETRSCPHYLPYKLRKFKMLFIVILFDIPLLEDKVFFD